MELHESLYELGLTSGRTVFDDADLLRAALDDYLDEGAASTGDINLLVDAVRLGAFRMMLTTIDSGAEPTRAVEAAGELLARDRGSSDVNATRWACAVLGFAVGKVSATDVRRFDRHATHPRPETPAPATTLPPTPPPVSPTPTASGPWGPPTTSPVSPPPTSPPYPSSAYPAAYPGAYASAPPPRKRRNPWVLPSIVGAVLLVIGGIVAAILLSGGDKDETATDDPSDPTTSESTNEPTGEQITGNGYTFTLPESWRDVTADVIAAGNAGATDKAVAWGATLEAARANLVVETGYAQGETDPEALREQWESNMEGATGVAPVDNGTANFDGETAIAVKISRVNENNVEIEQFGYLSLHDGDLFSVILSAEAGDEKAQQAFTDILDSWTWSS